MPCNLFEWAEFMQCGNSRIVYTTIGSDVFVSTVFLGMDHGFGMGGPPILFETLIGGSGMDGKMYRYETMKEAEKGHYDCVDKVRYTLCGTLPVTHTVRSEEVAKEIVLTEAENKTYRHDKH